MIPLIPLPEFLSELAQVHEMAAWITFIFTAVTSVVLITVISTGYDGSQREKDSLRFYTCFLAYGTLSLIGGLYVVAPVIAAATVKIFYYVVKGILIALFPKKF